MLARLATETGSHGIHLASKKSELDERENEVGERHLRAYHDVGDEEKDSPAGYDFLSN